MRQTNVCVQVQLFDSISLIQFGSVFNRVRYTTLYDSIFVASAMSCSIEHSDKSGYKHHSWRASLQAYADSTLGRMHSPKSESCYGLLVRR